VYKYLNKINTFRQQIYINDFIDKSHFKYLKYILGVNKKSTNLAVLSELGRYPLYFSVVLSMLTYWFRIDKMESGLLSDAYIANQSMVSDNTECWLPLLNLSYKN
jgi:hypothetical protein